MRLANGGDRTPKTTESSSPSKHQYYKQGDNQPKTKGLVMGTERKQLDTELNFEDR